jgi:threonylcarbamoyladenosine tRNA methylthiotransferase MtaB
MPAPARPSYSLVTFGCRVNQADSLALECELRSRGVVVGSPESADVVIVNTCSVTASADQGARQTIRRLARTNPGAAIVVTGCYATRTPGDLASLPNVVRVVSNAEKDDLARQLSEAEPLTTARRYGDGEDACGAAWSPGVGGRTAMLLRIQTGCDERCSYCIIPSTRGSSRSRPLAGVLADVDRAVRAGYKEIVLTGVHLGSYGRDFAAPSSLQVLVGRLAERQEDVLFRISSLEPMDCAPELVEIVASSRRVAPHFHLPLQHGSAAVLAAMRRPYSPAFYERLVDGIRARLPHASIGSDLIVGFPGETAAQFEETRALVRRLPLTYLHVFPYSDRPGTDAAVMPGKVDGIAVRERGLALREIGHDMARRFRQANVGKTDRALTVDDGWSAVTPNYLKVRLDRQQPRNEWVQVRVDFADPLTATVVESPGQRPSPDETTRATTPRRRDQGDTEAPRSTRP